jgi:hypothetical protein
MRNKKVMNKLINKFLVPIFFSLFFAVIAQAEINKNFPGDSAYRPSEPHIDSKGEIIEKSVKRTKNNNPDIMLNVHGKAAPTYGSTGQILPLITPHGSNIVIPSLSKIVLIWYGNWTNGSVSDTKNGQDIIRDLIAGLADNNNSYVNITTSSKYAGNYGAYGVARQSSLSVSEYISPRLTALKNGSYYKYGSNISDANVKSLVLDAANSSIGYDANAIYLVLTSSDVAESSGFCSKYCGWHTYTTILSGASTTAIKYAFIGNANRCLSGCAAQTITSPNGNPGVDGMASVIAHELQETVTDPQLNNWYDSKGYENADKCAWTYGATSPNPPYYNVTLNGLNGQRNFLLQRSLGSNSYCYSN